MQLLNKESKLEIDLEPKHEEECKEYNLPTNEDVEDALNNQDESFKVQNISIVEDMGEDCKNSKSDQKSFKMELLPPNIIADSKHSYGKSEAMESNTAIGIYHIKHKSNATGEDQMWIRRKAQTSRGEFSVLSSVDMDQMSAAQVPDKEAFF